MSLEINRRNRGGSKRSAQLSSRRSWRAKMIGSMVEKCVCAEGQRRHSGFRRVDPSTNVMRVENREQLALI